MCKYIRYMYKFECVSSISLVWVLLLAVLCTCTCTRKVNVVSVYSLGIVGWPAHKGSTQGREAVPALNSVVEPATASHAQYRATPCQDPRPCLAGVEVLGTARSNRLPIPLSSRPL